MEACCRGPSLPSISWVAEIEGPVATDHNQAGVNRERILCPLETEAYADESHREAACPV